MPSNLDFYHSKLDFLKKIMLHHVAINHRFYNHNQEKLGPCDYESLKRKLARWSGLFYDYFRA